MKYSLENTVCLPLVNANLLVIYYQLIEIEAAISSCTEKMFWARFFFKKKLGSTDRPHLISIYSVSI